MKNNQILLTIGLLVASSRISAHPCMRAYFSDWGHFADVFEAYEHGFELRREAAFDYMMDEIAQGSPCHGSYNVKVISKQLGETSVQVNQVDKGLEIVIPAADADRAKISVAHIPSDDQYQKSETVIAHVPSKNGMLEVRLSDGFMYVEHKAEQSSSEDHAAAYLMSQAQYTRSLPMQVDLKSVDVCYDKDKSLLRLMFSEKQAQVNKILIKGLDAQNVVEASSKTELLDESSVELDLK